MILRSLRKLRPPPRHPRRRSVGNIFGAWRISNGSRAWNRKRSGSSSKKRPIKRPTERLTRKLTRGPNWLTSHQKSEQKFGVGALHPLQTLPNFPNHFTNRLNLWTYGAPLDYKTSNRASNKTSNILVFDARFSDPPQRHLALRSTCAD